MVLSKNKPGRASMQENASNLKHHFSGIIIHGSQASYISRKQWTEENG
jgi:hypothetical protein